MNNYEKVKSLDVGTIFHFGGGPWMRTVDGMTDLLIAAHYPTSTKGYNKSIPEGWENSNYEMTIIYSEEE